MADNEIMGRISSLTPEASGSVESWRGPQGEKGETGAKGETGSQGPKGDTGATGPQGPKGDTGATGAQGPKGDKGDKGDTGATGAAGADGHTPVRGTDYWTASDKAEIVEDVLDTEEISDLSDDVSNLKTAITTKLDSPSTAGTSGQVLTSDGNGGQTWEDPTGAVEDVKINGTSVVNNGVANVPIMSETDYGLSKLGNGLQIQSGTNKLATSRASSAQIKGGTELYRPIVPAIQDSSVFYGLTKAAGVDMASSSNAVGTYTDEAKIAIQKMLGIYEPPFELIEDFTLAEEGRFDKTTEPDGTLYNFRGVFIRVFYAANLQTASTGYGRYMCEDSDGTYINTETGKYTTQTSTYAKFVYIMRNGAMAIAVYSRAAATGGAVSWQHKDNTGIRFDFKNIKRIYMNAADVEPAGTRIQIYAQRAY